MLTLVDNIIVVAAVIGILFVAAYFSKTVQDMESYFVCNKSLPWSLTVGTLVSTWYGGVGTLGSVEWFAIYGLSMFLMWCFTGPCGQNSSSLVDRAEDADQNGHDRAGCIETFLR